MGNGHGGPIKKGWVRGRWACFTVWFRAWWPNSHPGCRNPRVRYFTSGWMSEWV